ncbi:hypothetical protein TNCV_3561781 [Trichonephila clavipes]|nr:hypothetical protein TNCV_3561781 [Trichonephila clavipes]
MTPEYANIIPQTRVSLFKEDSKSNPAGLGSCNPSAEGGSNLCRKALPTTNLNSVSTSRRVKFIEHVSSVDFRKGNHFQGERGELLGRIDRQNSRFRTAKTIIIKFGFHASFVELESAKNAFNEVRLHCHQDSNPRFDRNTVNPEFVTMATCLTWLLTGTEKLCANKQILLRNIFEVKDVKHCALVMTRRKQRSAFDQASEFDRGRTVAYRDCGLSFRKIGSRVGRNQTTVM